MGVRIWGQLKGCELELVQEIEEVGCYREPKPRFKMLAANGYKARWGIGHMTALSEYIHSTVR